MEAVLLVIHLIACLALIGAVLLQRSEGGALGMSGGGTGGFISGRGVADVLVRTTMILGAGFFLTSLVLARIHSESAKRDSGLERTIEERNNRAFDPLSGGATGTAQPGTSTPGSVSSTPAPASAPPATDPLAPVLSQPQPSPAATSSARNTAKPEGTAPSTDPAVPAPRPDPAPQ